jgi:hypothetical protein
MVTKEDWAIVCQDVKNKCTFATKGLIIELDRRFWAQELINATSIIYLWYWVQLEVALRFLEHLQILKSHYCYYKMTQLDGKLHSPLLDHGLLEQ